MLNYIAVNHFDVTNLKFSIKKNMFFKLNKIALGSMLSKTRRLFNVSRCLVSQCRSYQVTAEHESLKDNLWKLIEKEINPHCDEWEKDKIFPAHKVFKLLGWFLMISFRCYICLCICLCKFLLHNVKCIDKHS